MSDVAVAFQQTAQQLAKKLDAALDVLALFAATQDNRDNLNGGDFEMTEIKRQAKNVLFNCGRKF